MDCFLFSSQAACLPQFPSKSHVLPLGAQRGHQGPLSPFLAISCTVRQKRADIFTHLPFVNVEHCIPVKGAIILICARLGGGSRRSWEGVGGRSGGEESCSRLLSVWQWYHCKRTGALLDVCTLR